MTLKIKPSYFYDLYRPSKCDLRLYLQMKGVKPAPPSAFEEVLFRLGQRHEKNHLLTFPEFSDLTGEPYESTLKEIGKASPVIYQGELQAKVSVDGQVLDIVGIPDFMIKEGAGYLSVTAR